MRCTDSVVLPISCPYRLHESPPLMSFFVFVNPRAKPEDRVTKTATDFIEVGSPVSNIHQYYQLICFVNPVLRRTGCQLCWHALCWHKLFFHRQSPLNFAHTPKCAKRLPPPRTRYKLKGKTDYSNSIDCKAAHRKEVREGFSNATDCHTIEMKGASLQSC